MRHSPIACGRPLAWLPLLALAGCAPAGQAQVPPRGPEQAPPLYWVVAVLAIAALAGFFVWVAAARRIRVGLGYATLGGLVGVLVLFTLVVHVIPATGAQQAAPTARAWDYRPGEVIADPGGSNLRGEPYRGYQLYVANGCIYCHTGYVRPQDVGTGWAEGATAEDVAATGDFVGYPATVLGTQRNAPDLFLEGRRVPDMAFQVSHLENPRQLKPASVMPSFARLPRQDLVDLAAYLVTLGNEPAKVRAGEVGAGSTAGLSPEAKRGAELYRSLGCVGCHTVNGQASVGPTWKGLWGKAETMQDGSVVTVDASYVEESILKPGAKVVKGFQNVMPSFEGKAQPADIQAIEAYLQTLR